jgi:hypothetical protein
MRRYCRCESAQGTQEDVSGAVRVGLAVPMGLVCALSHRLGLVVRGLLG